MATSLMRLETSVGVRCIPGKVGSVRLHYRLLSLHQVESLKVLLSCVFASGRKNLSTFRGANYLLKTTYRVGQIPEAVVLAGISYVIHAHV